MNKNFTQSDINRLTKQQKIDILKNTYVTGDIDGWDLDRRDIKKNYNTLYYEKFQDNPNVDEGSLNQVFKDALGLESYYRGFVYVPQDQGFSDSDEILDNGMLGEVVVTPTFEQTYMLDRFPTEITRTLNDYYLAYNPDSQKEVFNRLYNMHTQAGDPTVKLIKESSNKKFVDTGRAHIRYRDEALNHAYNTMYANDFDDYMAELSHPIQHKVMGHPNLYGDETYYDDDKMYDDPNHFEYKTHEIIEPLLKQYIIDGKTPPFINWMNKLQWWRPIGTVQKRFPINK